MYVMPGFVDNHVHAGGPPKNADAEYAYKLWMAHGVTTVTGVPLAEHAFTVSEKARSARNEIVAPRIVNYQRPGAGWDRGAIDTPEQAREWVRWGKANGIDGLKLGAQRPEIMAALLDEAKKNYMGSTAHLQQTGVAQMNALKAAQLGLQTGHALLRSLRSAAARTPSSSRGRSIRSTTTSRCASARSRACGTRSIRPAARNGPRT